MTLYLSNRDGNGKTSEEGHYKFQTAVWAGSVLGSTALQVSQNSPTGMSVLIAPGQFKIDTSNDYAYTGWNTANYALTITTADPANPRITTVVAYVDKGASTSASPPNNPGIVKFMAVNGTPTASPGAPSGVTIQSAVGASNPYIILADITVPTGATEVVNANISDQRAQVTLGTNLVATSSILDGAISSPKLADLAVTTSKLANLSVTSAKIADGALDDSKWANGILFNARRTTTRNIAASTWTKMAPNSISYNYGGGYSNASDIGRFTAPVTGVYAFFGTLYAGAATNVRAIIEMRKNGSASDGRVSDITGPAGTALRTISGTTTYALNAGDYVEPWVWTSVATNVNSSSGGGNTEFGGALITRTP